MQSKSRFVRGVQLLALLAGLLLPFQPVAAAAPKPSITVGGFSFVLEGTTELPLWGTARATDVSWKGSPAYIELGFAYCGLPGCAWSTDMPSTRIAVDAKTVQPASIQLSVNLHPKGALCTMGLRLLDRKGNVMGTPLLDPNWMKGCPDSVHS